MKKSLSCVSEVFLWGLYAQRAAAEISNMREHKFRFTDLVIKGGASDFAHFQMLHAQCLQSDRTQHTVSSTWQYQFRWLFCTLVLYSDNKVLRSYQMLKIADKCRR